MSHPNHSHWLYSHPHALGPLGSQESLAECPAAVELQPSSTYLGGVPSTPCTSQQPLWPSEGVCGIPDSAVLPGRTHPVCWEVPELSLVPESILTKDPRRVMEMQTGDWW